MAHLIQPNGKISVPKITVISSVHPVPLYKNRDFLYEKYVEKQWSASQIADEVGSVHSTILKHLRDFNIPVRDHQKPLQKKPGRGLSYGRKVSQRSEIAHQAELDNIAKMIELRNQGFSYWKIADIFNSMGVPTKTRRAKWHPTTVMKILKTHSKAMSRN